MNDPEPIDLFRHYRGEIQHEMELMLARLNALLTSQSFLMIAYATSMAISSGHWDQPFSLLLPPFLALLGFVLAMEGRTGVLAARTALWRWQGRLAALVAEHDELLAWSDMTNENALGTQRAGEIFAVRPPLVFMVAWVWLLLLPFILRFVT
ncbi:hypothetical protein G6L26_027385 (plasmid) [Agrobacterium radiobacter]|uniref:Uncharacterized protein n=1 Tax=Agrobacterium tumefaciens str. B6 TaxID=1183423 RepID=A0A822VCV0_AGRTU|nr:hypothetical protein [Agrobacterium tumefaciens]MQB27861.1 hypothetical protein [Agrobacterium tumefaciens]NTA08365.1 hypothetical protein [Agrobacterium tumefaciens]NTB16187.1 hypothetical protein [Agrobacterium tumefaciens]CVI25221.1 hypothetical protein AGR4A_pAt30036 [Agrobacterium tumefaciens str. B6]SPZ33136.1 Uncharacterised protein [Agrobacterium tumefaciens]